MQAVAARYSGNFDPDGAGPEPQLPAAQAEEVWNEANSSDWLTPQYEGKTAVGVERYRQMLNASYKSIKSVNPKMLVLAGATEPYGDKPGGARVQPVQFWQQLLCVHPKKGKKGRREEAGRGQMAAPRRRSTSSPIIRSTTPAPARCAPGPWRAMPPPPISAGSCRSCGVPRRRRRFRGTTRSG